MYKFFGFLNRMKYINRWSLMRSNVSENIMEHSQQVAMVAHCLATVGNTYFGQNLDVNAITAKALFHETSEVITGDLPTPIKYFNSDIKFAYKNLEKIANDKLLATLPSEMQPTYSSIFDESDSEQKRFVKYADKLCAYIKCVEELKSGNGEFSLAAKSIRSELDAFDSKEVKYFIDNFLPAYSMTLDELNS